MKTIALVGGFCLLVFLASGCGKSEEAKLESDIEDVIQEFKQVGGFNPKQGLVAENKRKEVEKKIQASSLPKEKKDALLKKLAKAHELTGD